MNRKKLILFVAIKMLSKLFWSRFSQLSSSFSSFSPRSVFDVWFLWAANKTKCSWKCLHFYLSVSVWQITHCVCLWAFMCISICKPTTEYIFSLVNFNSLSSFFVVLLMTQPLRLENFVGCILIHSLHRFLPILWSFFPFSVRTIEIW